MPRHYRDGRSSKIFFFNVIVGDETWCIAKEPDKKRQSSKCVGEISPLPKKLKFQMCRIKITLINFLTPKAYCSNICTRGKTVSAEYYKGVMDRLLKHIHGVRPAAFCSRDFFLLHKNVTAHKAASVCQFLT